MVVDQYEYNFHESKIRVKLEAGSSDDRRLHRPAWGIVRAASDWSIVIISTLPNSLTGSRGRVF